jgi:hypothetical protein
LGKVVAPSEGHDVGAKGLTQDSLRSRAPGSASCETSKARESCAAERCGKIHEGRWTGSPSSSRLVGGASSRDHGLRGHVRLGSVPLPSGPLATVPLRFALLASGRDVARCGTCCAGLGDACGNRAATGWVAGDSADGVTNGRAGCDSFGSDKAGWDEADRDEAACGRTGRGCADLGGADQDGSDCAGADAASRAVSVWRAGAFLAFLGCAFGGCLCHTRAVTKMSSFSANGAIRHQARGSAT